VAGEGVDASLLGTITRDDGTMQVTYNGWPLYFFHEDAAAGDTNGQGIDEFGGLWWLVSPAGEAIEQ
jgi:predicted lipoprotein with Yx(FWY)xxD motif